jgi:hypothetical protein
VVYYCSAVYSCRIGLTRSASPSPHFRWAFRKKLYRGLEELQADLDQWIGEYNRERAHSGKYCYGKTPLQTFLDSRHLAQAKMLDRTLTTSAATQDERAEPETERSHAERSAGGGVARGAAA